MLLASGRHCGRLTVGYKLARGLMPHGPWGHLQPLLIAYARGIEKVGSLVKVLFVDDDPVAHETLRLILPDSFVLLSAYTARQGVEVSAREGPDVVLLDITLPDGDGLHALRQIGARPLYPPVVMLTVSEIRQSSLERYVEDLVLNVPAVGASPDPGIFSGNAEMRSTVARSHVQQGQT